MPSDTLPLGLPDASAALTITTRRFGAPEAVQVAAASLYTFPDALPGLPDSHRYALIQDDAYAPLCWLQSLDEEPVCLPLLGLAALDMEAYAAHVARALATTEAEDEGAYPGRATEVLLVTRFDDEVGLFAVNLLAPVVLDRRTATGRQVVLDAPMPSEQGDALRSRTPSRTDTRVQEPTPAGGTGVEQASRLPGERGCAPPPAVPASSGREPARRPYPLRQHVRWNPETRTFAPLC